MNELFRLLWGLTSVICQFFVALQLGASSVFVLNVIGVILFILAVYGLFSYIEYAVKLITRISDKRSK